MKPDVKCSVVRIETQPSLLPPASGNDRGDSNGLQDVHIETIMDSHGGVACLLIGHDCHGDTLLLWVHSAPAFLEISTQTSWRRRQD